MHCLRTAHAYFFGNPPLLYTINLEQPHKKILFFTLFFSSVEKNVMNAFCQEDYLTVGKKNIYDFTILYLNFMSPSNGQINQSIFDVYIHVDLKESYLGLVYIYKLNVYVMCNKVYI